MPEVHVDMDIYNTFNFNRDIVTPIGHATSLTIGELKLAANISLKEPINEANTKVAMAMSNFSWSTGEADPIRFMGVVDLDNKNGLQSMLFTTMKSTKVEIGFSIYEYDEDAKAYFKSVWVDADLKGVLRVEGTERDIYLAKEAGAIVQQPKNYELQFSLVPEDTQQDIQLAVSQTKKFVKKWGVTRG